MAKDRLFPIIGISHDWREDVSSLRANGATMVMISIPWPLIAPHEERAKANHGGQTLERLAARGGLSAAEAVAVLEDRKVNDRPLTKAEANHTLFGYLFLYITEEIGKKNAPTTETSSRGPSKVSKLPKLRVVL